MFAKLYETDIGQILVKIDDGDDGPEVRYFFQPKGLGLCNFSLNWKDDSEDDAWDKAESVFEKTTKETAEEAVRKLLEQFDV